ncbi:zinc ribbon domain-containing protein [Sphingomonas sp. ABOLD]|uniref:Zinc-ribbon domain-containing protein n=1 Tax=Sphingomonas trueperi TaxID=53317 RepID=A0A7X6BDR3_9SPHN|nr:MULTISPECIES: zinc ribbon domain-containing protein [Sphingomonas]NJB99409.1 hypothetical protein [Sphingomonas trueperi]RSV34837.1 zinc ribbon domain-containing protein [Sphingomonas sp. ABOLE]RSV40931.1 zinc ribbon domain-containing protein [Sphingomonas sp. ABOLD]
MAAYCSDCGEKLPEGARFCSHCGVPVSALVPSGAAVGEAGLVPEEVDAPSAEADQVAPTVPDREPERDTLTPIMFGGVGIVMVGLLIAALGSSISANQNEIANSQDILAVDAAAPIENAADSAAAASPARAWQYSSSEDNISGKQILTASVQSSNEIQQGFPYGESGLTATIRRHPRWGRDVYFTLGSGQLVCGVMDSCYALVRFDDGPARRVSLAEPSDHSSGTLFASGSLAASMLKAKKMVVEIEVYQAGRPQFSFDTAGLDAKRAGL